MSQKRKRCANCSMWRKKLFQCAGCKVVFYCGRKCQKSGWRTHKRVCGKKLVKIDNPIRLGWTEISSGGDLPGKLNGLTCHTLAERGDIILIGGDALRFDYFIYNVSKNEFQRKKSPVAIEHHSSCLFSTPNKSFILVYGGLKKGRVHIKGEREYSSDLHEVEILSTSENWKEVCPRGLQKPLERYGHSCVASSDQKFMIMFGGDCGKEQSNRYRGGELADIWKYDVNKQIWEEIQPTSELKPSPRKNHSCALFKNKMIVGCGNNSRGYRGTILNDFWEFDFSTSTWKELLFTKQEEMILPRTNHKMVVIKNQNNGEENILMGTGKYYDLDDNDWYDIREYFYNKQVDDLWNMKSFWMLSSEKSERVSTKNDLIFWDYAMTQYKNKVYIFGGSYPNVKKMKSKNGVKVDYQLKDHTSIGILHFQFPDISIVKQDVEERIGFLKDALNSSDCEWNSDMFFSLRSSEVELKMFKILLCEN